LPHSEYDYCVIGGGIVGLATAMALQDKFPSASIVLLEKEDGLARHQTGHNSGVIHSGIYYQPGSLKARLCLAGAEATKQFCRNHGVPFEECGKLLVATTPVEVERMERLAERAAKNAIEFSKLDGAELRQREPEVTGLAALHVPSTGIVDYAAVCRAMAAAIRARGAVITLASEVDAIEEHADGVRISAGDVRISANMLVACAGLQSDRLARLAGMAIEHAIVPFRGEYYTLPKRWGGMVKHLIYPIPDPDLPFLGIHLTRMIDGSVEVGPNAVLGFAREGYPKFSISPGDIGEMLGFGGFWKVIAQNWRSGMDEFAGAMFKRRYLAACQKYSPSLQLSDLGQQRAGIRAQAVLRDGTLVHDFLFLQSPRMLHVCNAPSPAATSAIPIGQMIVERLIEGKAA
jgi:L-2-hydroxyglutarate oxidase